VNELGLIIHDEKVVVGSRKVAEVYEKEHRHVLDSIRGALAQVPEAKPNFRLSEYKDSTGRNLPEYLMDRQGFSMLVMGFTGEKARRFTYQYTLAFEQMAAELQKPKTQLEILQQSINALVEQESRIKSLETTTQSIKETIIAQPDNWREDINRMINKIVDRIGGKKFSEVRTESYSLLEQRAHVDLTRRLQNLQIRLMNEGATKTTINKANKMDVIEADPKLREIYTAIIKEYTIKYVA